jgi:LAO/AO transport system kinase
VARARDEVEAIALRRLRAELADLRGGGRLAGVAERVVARELDPFAAADALIADLRG